MDINEKFEFIRANTSEASQYEQLAEECTELAHVAQKLARYLRGEQPVAEDFDFDEESLHLLVEYADTILCLHVLCPLYDPDKTEDEMNDIVRSYYAKLDRWVDRIKERLERERGCQEDRR